MENVDMYSDAEQQKLQELDALYADWKKAAAKHFIKFKDDGKKYPGDSYFGEDGFLPNYFSQNKKVLFIGREARWHSKSNIIDTILEACKNGKRFGSDKVFKTMFYIAYGIKHRGTKKWDDVPSVDDIAAEMLSAKDFCFAFMNFSKYSNDSETGATADETLINDFLEHSQLNKRNFIREELEILDPDVIITMNLWDGKIKDEFLDLVFPGIKEKSSIEGKASLSEMPLGAKTVKVIDLYHFAASKERKGVFP